jgi:predicted 3-demethylubiquinone-9 3-methyltransferase (glyoxalase superfamily)
VTTDEFGAALASERVEDTDTRKRRRTMPSIRPNLWFDTNAKEAAEFYCGIFPSSKITNVTHYTEAGPGEPGSVLTVEFELDGSKFVGINGGPEFTFSEAVSFEILCKDQAEVDYYWEKLTAGGQEVQCGWLKDRYGLSWQVVPEAMIDILNDGDTERADRTMRAMLGMVKLDMAALQAAADGVTV